MKLSRSLIFGSLLLFAACSKSDAPPPEPEPEPKPEPEVPVIPTVKVTVVQKDVKIPEATVKFIYDDNGLPKTTSALTNAEGKISMDLPLNKEMQMTITSKCGILLYDRKVGPFTATKKMDTTLKMEAYSPDCETSPPDQYLTFNIQGVVYRHATAGEFSFNITDSDRMTYWARKSQAAWVAMEIYHFGFGTMFIGVNAPGISYSTSATTANFTEKGDFGDYISGTFVMDLEHLYGGGTELAPDYKIPGTFRFKRRHYKEDPNWEMFFPE